MSDAKDTPKRFGFVTTKSEEPRQIHDTFTEKENGGFVEFSEYEKMRAQRDALVAALEMCGVHPDTCGKWIHEPRGSVLGDRACTCGLDAALKLARGES